MNITRDPVNNLASAKMKLLNILDRCTSHIWHVGITTNIDRRKYGEPYRFLKVNGKRFSGYVQEFHLLYETDNRADVVMAEKALITTARGIGPYHVSGMIAGNVRDGGGGRIAIHGPHYVYVALGG